MGTIGAGLVVLISLGLVAAGVVQLRSGPLPFPAIITGALTCTVCYIVAGTVDSDSTLPSVPTVVGSLVGVLTLVAMVISLIPREPERDRTRRSPIYLAVSGTFLGAAGLLVHVLA